MMNENQESSQQLEDAIIRFEEEWTPTSSQTIRSLLPDDSALANRLLWELVQVDLELRLKDGQEARVEEYIDLFPELQEDQERLAELIESEFRHRQRLRAQLQRVVR